MNRVVSIYVHHENDKRCFVPDPKVGNARFKPQPGGVVYIRWSHGSKPIAKTTRGCQ